MNHWDRLAAALCMEPLDHKPIALWRAWPEFAHDPLALARAVTAWQRRFDFDLAVFAAPLTAIAESFGASPLHRCNSHGRMQVDHLHIGDARQWLDLRSAPSASRRLIDLNAGLRRVADALGGTVPLIQTVPSPLTTAWLLAGSTLFEQMRSAPDEVEAGVRAIAESTLAFARTAVDAGACGIRLFSHIPASAMFTREDHVRFGRRFDLEVLQSVGAGPQWNLLELDAPASAVEFYVDYPVQIFGLRDREGTSDASDLTARISGIVAAGIDPEGPLLRGTPSECYDATVAALVRFDRVRTMIATGGACRSDTSEANIDALIDAVMRPAERVVEERKQR